MKKYFGGYEICKALGYPLGNYIKITNFLSLVNAPAIKNNKLVKCYCLTENQVVFLHNALEHIKKDIKTKL